METSIGEKILVNTTSILIASIAGAIISTLLIGDPTTGAQLGAALMSNGSDGTSSD